MIHFGCHVYLDLLNLCKICAFSLFIPNKKPTKKAEMFTYLEDFRDGIHEHVVLFFGTFFVLVCGENTHPLTLHLLGSYPPCKMEQPIQDHSKHVQISKDGHFLGFRGGHPIAMVFCKVVRGKCPPKMSEKTPALGTLEPK